jgi:hypothetical protein
MARNYKLITAHDKKLARRTPSLLAAAVSGIAVVAAVILPASAASATAAASAVPVAHYSPAVADAWHYYAQYPTKSACTTEGNYLVRIGATTTYKCTEINKGSYFVWDLYTWS